MEKYLNYVWFEFLKVKPFEDIHSGVGSQSLGASLEKIRVNVANNDKPIENLMQEIRANFINIGFGGNEANGMVTPGNSGKLHLS